MGTQLVWFKRDLRVHDHAPLLEAARRGPVLCLYVIEPGLWQQPDMAAQHLGFVREGFHPKAGPGGSDLISLGMLRDTCRFIPKATP